MSASIDAVESVFIHDATAAVAVAVAATTETGEAVAGVAATVVVKAGAAAAGLIEQERPWNIGSGCTAALKIVACMPGAGAAGIPGIEAAKSDATLELPAFNSASPNSPAEEASELRSVSGLLFCTLKD
jgi:hypothetical protein